MKWTQEMIDKANREAKPAFHYCGVCKADIKEDVFIHVGRHIQRGEIK